MFSGDGSVEPVMTPSMLMTRADNLSQHSAAFTRSALSSGHKHEGATGPDGAGGGTIVGGSAPPVAQM